MKEYKYAKFHSCIGQGRAGEQLAEFLNSNPDIEIVSIQFTNTETYKGFAPKSSTNENTGEIENSFVHKYDIDEYAHLIYRE